MAATSHVQHGMIGKWYVDNKKVKLFYYRKVSESGVLESEVFDVEISTEERVLRIYAFQEKNFLSRISDTRDLTSLKEFFSNYNVQILYAEKYSICFIEKEIEITIQNRDCDNRILLLNIKPSEKIQRIFQTFQHELREEGTLFYNGYVLDPQKTFADYKISQQANISYSIPSKFRSFSVDVTPSHSLLRTSNSHPDSEKEIEVCIRYCDENKFSIVKVNPNEKIQQLFQKQEKLQENGLLYFNENLLDCQKTFSEYQISPRSRISYFSPSKKHEHMHPFIFEASILYSPPKSSSSRLDRGLNIMYKCANTSCSSAHGVYIYRGIGKFSLKELKNEEFSCSHCHGKLNVSQIASFAFYRCRYRIEGVMVTPVVKTVSEGWKETQKKTLDSYVENTSVNFWGINIIVERRVRKKRLIGSRIGKSPSPNSQ